MSASSEGGAGGSGTGNGGGTAPTPSAAAAAAASSLVSHTHPPLHLRGVINKYSLPHLPSAAHSTVAAKITHVKTDGAGLNVGVGGISITGTPILSGGTIKVAANTVQQSSLGATPIALNTGQATTAASIRAIGAGGQSTQVRVVMPMIKQLENVTATGRTQITAIPATPARSVSNASITVTRPVTQATYLPRASVTATQMGGVGVGVNLGLAAGQRLVTPLRTTSTGSATVTPTASTGLSTSGGFVRGTAATVSRSGVAVSSQQPSTVISSSNNATWMQSPTGQMQLIRAIHQPRQRIITTSAGVSSASVVTTGVQAPTALSVTAAQPLGQQQQGAGGPQAYVATVLPPRQHQATLVYSSNVSAGGPNANAQQGQQFNPRFAVTTPTAGGVVTTTTPGGTTVTPRQVRPIPLGKSFPATKLNTTSISIRAPSIPQLNASVSGSQTPVSVSGGATVGPGRGPGLGGTALTATNLPTRIIQLQQQGPGAAQQIIGAGARLAGNVMLQPFLMSTSAAAKMGIRPPVTMTAKVQPSLTITQLNPIGKLSTPGGGGGAPNMTPQGVGVASIQAVPVPNVSGSVVNPNSVSGQATAAAGGATVLPLTISGRGGGHALTGTLTPIKNASGITVGKMMMTPAVTAGGAMGADQSGTTVTGFPRAWNPVVASQSQLMKIDDKGSSATIYYESMPASASTGVLSLTTTTLTQSTQSQAQLVSSAGGSLSVSSLPFPSHAPMGVGAAGPGSQATFTVLPSGATVGGAAAGQPRGTIGHQQLIIPAGGNSAPPQHMVIPLHTSVKVTTGGVSSQPATISGPGGAGSTLVSSFMGKRVAEGSPIRAAKNLGPTLLSMASNTSGPSLVSAAGSTFNLQPVSVSVASSVAVTSTALTVEALAKKERERATTAVVAAATAVRNLRADSPASSDGSTTVSANSSPGVDQQQLQDRIGEPQAASAPSSRDNSTHFNPINELYSSHQSMQQQQQQSLSHASLGGARSSAFVDVQAPTPQQQQQQLSQQSSLLGQLQQQQQQAAAAARMNGTGSSSSSSYDCSVRKKPRRSTNDSQHSTQSQASLSLPPPTAEPTAAATAAAYMQKHNNGGLLVAAAAGPSSSSTSADINHRSSAPAVAGNKENANPVDFVLRRPRNCSLLNTYKPTHKLANNHFHRYTDVKPREERGASIIDLANQPNVQGKIAGWKLYHLRSQMEDLNESETFSLSKLESMLKDIEKNKEKFSEMERVSELLKGNIQRCKIITEGINESQNQIMKIFEHKPHVSDIINRCASKRNFKKRDKI
ncbi:mucin-19 isoform X2 [Drosophila guanche]|uniref:Blast:Histone deacetylase complex subunit SAP130-B n=1 Tax=Drosophila guanche TaxID=7266 RepID=A0A3B0J695_DROGU|nr:mucin-19 isoform X2 [Drosophila guanche]SPP77285.1 blast:Histone deacetylase complex subunit SAP130-B [Drosophila guanche]